MSEWRKIETVPKDPDYGYFLVWDANAGKNPIKIANWEHRGTASGIRDRQGGMLRYVTHWTPLPKPPHGDDKDDIAT